MFNSLEELQRHLDKIMREQNRRAIPEFEGYSPAEMQDILDNSFEENGIIRLKKPKGLAYQSVPVLNLVKYLSGLILKAGEMKLTLKGFLPVKIVADMYSQGFYKEYYIESGLTKLYKEQDSISIHHAKVLLLVSGLTKKRNNKLSITKKAEKIISNDYLLLKLLFKKFTEKFNWAYADGYGENSIGQLGYGYSLILVEKYGKKERNDRFYAEKYFNAYPALLNNLPDPGYSTIEEYAKNCYSIRTFERFLKYFGLIKIKNERRWDTDLFIAKSDFFNQIIDIQPPNSSL